MGDGQNNRDNYLFDHSNINLENSNENEIKILCLNVCGLSSKLKVPEFISFLNKYDIIGLQETKTDESDCIQLDGFYVHLLNRVNLSRRKSGGIALFVKRKLAQYVIDDNNSKSKLVKFFTISKHLYRNFGENLADLKCGIVYLPPASSKYAHDDPFIELQSEQTRYCPNSEHILLLGDYNSRCGQILFC